MNKRLKSLGLLVFCSWQTSQGGLNEELLAAAQKGNLTEVQQLLERKADALAKDEDGLAPLHVAVAEGQAEIVEYLLAQKGNINAKANVDTEANMLEATPLHVAAWKGQAKVAALLLAQKAEINIGKNNGNTPLHLAARYGHEEVAQLLLAQKADVGAKQKDGYTPLHLAALRC